MLSKPRLRQMQKRLGNHLVSDQERLYVIQKPCPDGSNPPAISIGQHIMYSVGAYMMLYVLALSDMQRLQHKV